jgi:hypothetical protein
LIVFACVFGGGLLGLFLRAALPERHLSGHASLASLAALLGRTTMVHARLEVSGRLVTREESREAQTISVRAGSLTSGWGGAVFVIECAYLPCI